MKVIGVLAVLFITIPILEFAILIEMGRRIGTLYTLLIVFGTGIVGAFLARMEGLRIVTRLRENVRRGVMPAEELLDGLLVLIAGVVLLTPGLLSDIAGLLLLFPLTRMPIKEAGRRIVRRWVASRTLHISVP